MSAIITLTDTFPGTTLDPAKWASYGTVSVASNILNVSGNSGVDTISTYDLTGSVAVNNAVSVKVNRVATGAAFPVTNLVISNPAVDGTNLRISYDNNTGLLSAQSQVAYADGSPTTVTYSSTTHAYWRIREAAGTIYFDTSADGLSWSTLRTIATSTASWINAAGFHLSVDNVAATLTAQFSNFNTIPGGNSKLLTLNDTFDTTLDSAVWATQGTPTPATGSGVLTIANTSGNGDVHSQKRYDATGAEISVNVTQVATNTATTAVTNMILSSLEANTDTRIQYKQSDGKIHFRHQISGVDAAEVSVTYDSNIHAFWRIRETGGTLFLETSPTGLVGSWTIQRQDNSTTIVTSTGAQYLTSVVAILSVDNGLAAIVGAKFDHLNNLPASVSTTKIHTLQDDFSVDNGSWALNGTASIGNSVATVPDGDVHTSSTYDLSSSLALVKVTSTAVGATAITNFIIDNPLVGGTSLRIVRDNSTSTLFFSRYTGYGPDGTDTTATTDTITYDPVAHLWWKIEEVSGTINFSTSPDGTNSSWVIRHHIPTSTAPWITDMNVFMSVDNVASSPALFNNFNIPVGFTPVINNYKASTLMDDFTGTTLDTTSKWVVLGTGGVSVNSQLQISPVNTEAQRGIESKAVYDLTASSFVVQTTGSGASGDEAVMRVYHVGGTEDVRISVTPSLIKGAYYLGGVRSSGEGRVVHDAIQPIWLRIREQDGDVFLECSNNGSFTDEPNLVFSVTIGTSPSWAANVKLQLLSDNTLINTTPVASVFTVTTDTVPTGTSFGIDFRTANRRFPTEPLDKWSIGYGVGGSDSSMILNDNTADGIYRALGGPLACRLATCGWEAGATPKLRQNSGSGALAAITQKIVSRGHTIYPVVVSNTIGPNDPTNTDDNNFTSAEFVRFLHYYNDNSGQNGGPIQRCAVGNEPVAGNSTWSRTPAQMAALFTSCWNAGNAIYPNVGITVPNAGDIVPQYTTDFMNAVTQSEVSGLSFHAYQGSQGGTYGTSEAAEIARLRAAYPGKYYGIEEFNWHFEYANSGDDAGWYNWKNLVYQAELIGRVLYAGGHAYQFNCEGTMGLISNGGNGGGLNGQPAQYSRLPSYWAIAAFTGCTGNAAVARNAIGGYVVPVTGTISGVYVWAVDVGKIIIVNQNTSGSSAITLGLGGCNRTGQYSVWQTLRSDTAQTTPYSALLTKANYTLGKISITVPFGTVTAIDVFA